MEIDTKYSNHDAMLKGVKGMDLHLPNLTPQR